ncbi:hypothetical protein SELMODRAFT_161156, partial [Selaginella moellendorffii]
MECVYIPVQNSQEEVRVGLDQLPRDPADIVDILKAEQAPLHLWLTFAREYFKQDKVKEFLQILEEGSSPEIDEYYSDVKYDRIAILNALGAYYTNLGKIEFKQRDEHFIRATHYYNKATRIDYDEPTTWAGKGQLLLAKGDYEQMFDVFKIVLDVRPDNLLALLGQACAQFNRGRFQESLGLYKRVLQMHPGCPASLDPENLDALVALGIMDINANDAESVQEGTKKMLEAFEIYPYCATALNHLANHYFYTEQHGVVEQLMETALASTDNALIKSQSYFNLARSYHSKGDYDKAAAYYRASVQELKSPKDFILPYYGLGQVQLKLNDLKSALSNFEKVLDVHPENCETLKVVGYIHLQQGRNDKALESFRKAAKVSPRDVDAWIEIGELLVSTDFSAALDAFKTAHNLQTKSGEKVPLGLLNNIGVLHFERGEYKLAEGAYYEALGEGPWKEFNENNFSTITGGDGPLEKFDVFQRIEEQGTSLDIPAEKVTVLFNLARLFEQLHETEKANLLYQLILFKHPSYVDAYLRLAAMAEARNNLSLSMELVQKGLKEDDNDVDILSFRGSLELKADEWLKAKDTLKGIQSVSDGKDSFSNLALGNWNYFAATRSEKRDPKLEATHLEKARELYQKVLTQKSNNMYAANGLGIVFSEKGMFDIAKDIFTQVQEAASGNVAVEMPDVWVNLAHVYLAQGHFGLAVKMYQNCLRRFYFNTETNILLYLARTHYEAEQWQECKRVLMHAIHMAPSNYMLRFDAAITMQKFSTATLQKQKRTADEVRQSVAEVKNAVRLFTQLSLISSHHMHGFDEKKIGMHVDYCKHLLDAAKLHLEAAEREEQQNRQKQEVARQLAMAQEAQRKADEERKLQIEKRKREEEHRRVMEQELHFQRVKVSKHFRAFETKCSAFQETWKYNLDDEGNERKSRRKEKKKRKKKQRNEQAEEEEVEAEEGTQPEPEEEEAEAEAPVASEEEEE